MAQIVCRNGFKIGGLLLRANYWRQPIADIRVLSKKSGNIPKPPNAPKASKVVEKVGSNDTSLIEDAKKMFDELRGSAVKRFDKLKHETEDKVKQFSAKVERKGKGMQTDAKQQLEEFRREAEKQILEFKREIEDKANSLKQIANKRVKGLKDEYIKEMKEILVLSFSGCCLAKKAKKSPKPMQPILTEDQLFEIIWQTIYVPFLAENGPNSETNSNSETTSESKAISKPRSKTDPKSESETNH